MKVKMLESQLERKVVEWCRRHHLLTYKFTSPSNRGVPDRIVVCPTNGCLIFVELKQQGKKPTALQLHEMERLRSAGCTVVWSDNYDDIITVLRDFCP